EDGCWQVRFEAVRGLAALGEAAAAGPLIKALGSEGGRLRDDIRGALRRLTGVDLGHDPDLWRSWWEANRARAPAERTRPDRGKSRASTRFYGVEVASKRIAFVIDVTGSMHKYHEIERAQEWLRHEADLKRPPYAGETLMDLEKYQLTNAIRELPDDAQFTVVLFSSAEVRACFPRLEPATAANREKATKFVRAMGWAGDTNLYEGLVRPFQLTGSQRKDFDDGPDTVLLFTDGDINAGRIRIAAEMRAAVRALHRFRRVRVDTIGIGTYDRRVLRSLAETTGGVFQDVPVPIDRVKEAGHSHSGGG
ncbi:MAG: VWA domain-containing protein, partial [Planctomycetales bacterium]|nr:VWA domain-containing protein [Planctomycetales bacterium]